MNDGWSFYDSIFGCGLLATTDGVPVKYDGEQEGWRDNIRNEMITFADGPAVCETVSEVIEEPGEVTHNAIVVIANVVLSDMLKAGVLFAVAKLIMLIIELI